MDVWNWKHCIRRGDPFFPKKPGHLFMCTEYGLNQCFQFEVPKFSHVLVYVLEWMGMKLLDLNQCCLQIDNVVGLNEHGLAFALFAFYLFTKHFLIINSFYIWISKTFYCHCNFYCKCLLFWMKLGRVCFEYYTKSALADKLHVFKVVDNELGSLWVVL